MTMLTKIGDSQGVRIPKPLIKQAHLENCQIEFIVTQNGLLLKPIHNSPREGWRENIEKVISQNKDNQDEGVLEEFLNLGLKSSEWEW